MKNLILSKFFVLALFLGVLSGCQKDAAVEPDWADALVGSYTGKVYVNQRETTEVAKFTLSKTGSKNLEFRDAEGTCQVTLTNKITGTGGTEYSASSTAYTGTYQGKTFIFTPYEYNFGAFTANGAYSESTKEFALMFKNSSGVLVGLIGKK